MTVLMLCSTQARADRTQVPDEEDFSGTPFTEYGEFNEEQDEAEDTRFFQFGRLFGVSVGVGYDGITGNRGKLWQGGFPLIDLKLHYWFDFNFALALGFYTAKHYFDNPATREHTDLNLTHLGVDLKYYFDTKNLSAPISFANPYVILGAGAFSKHEENITANIKDDDSAFGLSTGLGLEFALKPRKVYAAFEGKAHFVTFKDTYTTTYRDGLGLNDLTGFFYTLTGSLLFTW